MQLINKFGFEGCPLRTKSRTARFVSNVIVTCIKTQVKYWHYLTHINTERLSLVVRQKILQCLEEPISSEMFLLR